MRQCMKRLLLFAALLWYATYSAGAQEAKPQEPDLPDEPGARRVVRRTRDPVAAAERALPEFRVKILRKGRSIKHKGKKKRTARFRLKNEPASVLGRLDLTPIGDGAKREPVRFFLHGQKGESVLIAPGRYRLSAAFWRPSQAFPSDYPRTAEFKVARDECAVLEIRRRDYGPIKKWLDAIEKKAAPADPKQRGERKRGE